MSERRGLARGRHLTVLVEDHEDTRDLTRELLELEGFTVNAYGDAESALDGLRRMPLLPCSIILDVRLPGASGVDLIEVLRNDPALARVPVILTTAGAYEAVARFRLPYLRKPFDPDALLHVLRRQCHCGHDAGGDGGGDGKSGGRVK